MKIKELISCLSKLDGEIEVLGEFDNGDGVIVKGSVYKVYKGKSGDDIIEDDGKSYCIIRLEY